MQTEMDFVSDVRDEGLEIHVGRLLVLESLLDREFVEVLLLTIGSGLRRWLDLLSFLRHLLFATLHELFLTLFLAQRNSVLHSVLSQITILVILEPHLLLTVVLLLGPLLPSVTGTLSNGESTWLLV